jgi:hypothetical protein
MTSDVANFKLQLAIMEYLFLPHSLKKVHNFQFHPTEESQLNFFLAKIFTSSKPGD